MTASKAQAIGNAGKGLESLILELVSDYFSNSEKEKFESTDTERGNELEPLARNLYTLETGNEVEEVGFIEIENEYAGCSPDGLIGKDGGLEIKCPNDINFFKLVIGGEIDTKYIWQVQMNLLITKRKWWDLVFYNPNFSKSLLTFRIYTDKEKQEKIKEGLVKGKELIEKYLKLYNEK